MQELNLDNLRVYRMAEDLADSVWDLVMGWASFPRDTVGKQIVRAADSVGANLAEGYGRASPADNRRLVRTARGSLYETRHFLRRADRRNLIEPTIRPRLQALMRELPPSLNAYLRSLGNHRVADKKEDAASHAG